MVDIRTEAWRKMSRPLAIAEALHEQPKELVERWLVQRKQLDFNRHSCQSIPALPVVHFVLIHRQWIKMGAGASGRRSYVIKVGHQATSIIDQLYCILNVSTALFLW